ncbi:MAG: RNA-guided endonuclease InsQ/TnpB family protein [Candidatus Aenigmatarchaeota archaeon]
MEVTKTVVLKLEETDESISKTMEKYTEGMNFASKVVYENGEPISSNKLQELTYKHLRENVGLLSQMSCNVARQVAGAYSSLQKKVEKGKSKWKQIKFKPTNIKFSYGRDYKLSEEQLSISTLDGRKKYEIMNYDYAEQYLSEEWKYLASELVEHKDGEYYFHLTCEKEVEEKSMEEAKNFMGVDVGMNYLAVCTTTDKRQEFFGKGEAKDLRKTYEKMRQRLQSKGTFSALKRLEALSGKEKRLMKQLNHEVSKKVVGFAEEQSVDVIGMEDLTEIRDRTKVRKKQRYQHESWAFKQLQKFIEYKAKEKGIRVKYIDPKNTSKTCSRCGHINRSNRKGLDFECKKCGYELHADLNGARNIEHKLRDFRHDLESQGSCQPPDVDSIEGTSATASSGIEPQAPSSLKVR